jgi:hypothetical protein
MSFIFLFCTSWSKQNCLFRLHWSVGRILIWILEERGVRIWTGFFWPRIGTSGELLWTREWTFEFHRRRRISWLAEWRPLKKYSPLWSYLFGCEILKLMGWKYPMWHAQTSVTTSFTPHSAGCNWERCIKWETSMHYTLSSFNSNFITLLLWKACWPVELLD